MTEKKKEKRKNNIRKATVRNVEQCMVHDWKGVEI